jgi:hypothetical protein
MSRTTALTLCLALVGPLAGCGDPLLYLKVDEPSLVVTQSLPTVPGAPPVDVPAVTLPPGGLDIDIGDVSVDTSGSRSRLELRRATLAMVAASPGTDFSGIRSASLVITPPVGADLPQVVVASFDAVRDGTAGAALVLSAASPVDLLPYLSTHKLHVEIVAAGSPPGPLGTSWTADLALDFHLLAMVAYPE